MTDIRYVAPRTLDEAISAFAAAGSAARILAGGTDLLVQMRSGMVRPGLIVDIKNIAEMTGIEVTADGGFRVGAAVSGMALAEHPRFGKAWPGVLEAVNLIGSQVHRLHGQRRSEQPPGPVGCASLLCKQRACPPLFGLGRFGLGRGKPE